MYKNMSKNIGNNNIEIYNIKNKPKKNYDNYIIKSNDGSINLSLEKEEYLIEHFWTALSLCHTCSVEVNDDGIEEYICVSPDSIELVKAAKAQGWKYEDTGNPDIKLISLGCENDIKKMEYKKLEILEFSSDRKRETIIVKCPDGKIILYCKGADSIIEKRLSPNTNKAILAQCKHYVDKFSSQGLRTLFIAMKVLSQNEYSKFSKDLSEAKMSIKDKEKKEDEVCNKIEQNLYLIGTTIVEDKLQEKVPETIRDLRLAKIKVWMLTGDKMNTAYNIGLSCNLINKNMKIFNICGIEPKKDELTFTIINQHEREQVIIDFAKDFKRFKGNSDSMVIPQYGILVDEKALLTLEEDELIQKIFLDIAKDAVAVICCRVSPLQKSQVVKMMKNYNPKSKTLAIGDGGNDVSMIMEAHIGVGIYGEEGLRAVQNSDYAIGEFRFLHDLLFFHGRTNYIRNAQCIIYFFYKNFVFTFLQFVYGFYCNFTGQTIIDDWFITLFNLLFTSLPLGARALLDHDVKPIDGEIVKLMLPFLYLENRENPIFTVRNFFIGLLKGICHSLINFFYVIYMVDESVNGHGQMGDLWFCSINLFTNILIIVSIDLLIDTKYHTWINAVILSVITFISYIVFLVIVQHLSMFNSVGTVDIAFNSGRLWMNLLFVGGTCGMIDYTILCVEYVFFPNLTKTLQQMINKGINMNISNNKDIPNIIMDKLNDYNQFDENEEENKDNIINDLYNNKINKLKIQKTNKKKMNTNEEEIQNVEINKNINVENIELNNNKIKDKKKADIITLPKRNSRENNKIENNKEEDSNSKETFINDKNKGNIINDNK